MPASRTLRIGTAGWAIPRAVAERFPAEGSGLQRYAAVFNAAEINSTFYRPHRASTFARWAADTPPDFAFAVKIPKALTHEARLADCEAPLSAFVASLEPLGAKLRVLLVQLPPSLPFEEAVAEGFFGSLRAAAPELGVACEPRHASWFEPAADAVLARWRVARVAADPAKAAGAGEPGGWPSLEYHRLHGAPRMYFSRYSPEALDALAARLTRSPAEEAWCVFDNTASGAAAADALALQARLAAP